MNPKVSLSNTPMAHPPRSNPPLRSSSDAPPFPCITPSTVTCVMVVSFTDLTPPRSHGDRERMAIGDHHSFFASDGRRRHAWPIHLHRDKPPQTREAR